jgi:hypothetical protein
MEFLIVLGSGTFILGLAFVIWIAVTKRRGYGPPNWPSTAGNVVSAHIVPLERETPQGFDRTYTPVLAYTYSVAGQSYTGRLRNLLPKDSATYQDPARALRAIAKYPAGAPVKVHYNPSNPMQAILEIPKAVAHNTVLLYGITTMLAGAAIIVSGILLLP